MRIAAFGSGAVGGYFGGRLAQAGEDVVFLARGPHLEAIRSRGLCVASTNGNFVVHPAQATDDPADVGQVDTVLVAVKAWQVRDAAEAMRPMLGPETFIVPLQNGVEAAGQLGAALGPERVLGGFCRILGYITAPGSIRHVGVEPYIAFGELDGRRSERAERLRYAFSRTTGVTAEIPADIRVAMWRKFLLIAAWSGVGALTRAPIGVIRSCPPARQLLEQALWEIHAVAVAHGVALPEDSVEETLTFMDGAPPEGTASMQRDIADGRPSELESQSGAVVRLAREAGVTAPLHSIVYRSLLPLELRARGELRFSG